MELDDVRTFVSIADSGSVSLAARELRVTQSAVSRRLQRLEASLGVGLLDRDSRPMTLTAAGRSALVRCRRLLEEVRDLRATAAGAGFPAGEMQIGVAHALTEFTLIEPVRAVRRAFPKVVLCLATGWSSGLLERVRSRDLDAAAVLLAEGQSLPSGVSGERIAQERLVVVGARTEHPPGVRSVRELRGAQWILNPEGCAARASLRSALRRADLGLRLAVETYNYELQLALVAENRGLGLVPERILNCSALRRRIRVLDVRDLDFRLGIWILRREGESVFGPVVQELTRALQSRLAACPDVRKASP